MFSKRSQLTWLMLLACSFVFISSGCTRSLHFETARVAKSGTIRPFHGAAVGWRKGDFVNYVVPAHAGWKNKPDRATKAYLEGVPFEIEAAFIGVRYTPVSRLQLELSANLPLPAGIGGTFALKWQFWGSQSSPFAVALKARGSASTGFHDSVGDGGRLSLLSADAGLLFTFEVAPRWDITLSFFPMYHCLIVKHWEDELDAATYTPAISYGFSFAISWRNLPRREYIVELSSIYTPGKDKEKDTIRIMLGVGW